GTEVPIGATYGVRDRAGTLLAGEGKGSRFAGEQAVKGGVCPPPKGRSAGGRGKHVWPPIGGQGDVLEAGVKGSVECNGRKSKVAAAVGTRIGEGVLVEVGAVRLRRDAARDNGLRKDGIRPHWPGAATPHHAADQPAEIPLSATHGSLLPWWRAGACG